MNMDNKQEELIIAKYHLLKAMKRLKSIDDFKSMEIWRFLHLQRLKIDEEIINFSKY